MNKNDLVLSLASEYEGSKAHAQELVDFVLGSNHERGSEGRRGCPARVRPVQGHGARRPQGPQPADWRAREDPGQQAGEVRGG